MMSEAMKRLHWEEFQKWLSSNNYEFRLDCLNASIAELTSEIENIRNEYEFNDPRLQEKLEASSLSIYTFLLS